GASAARARLRAGARPPVTADPPFARRKASLPATVPLDRDQCPSGGAGPEWPISVKSDPSDRKEWGMQARDIMTSPAICVAEDAPVADVARRLLAHRISAVPVTDAEGRLVGIVSEGDLVRRVELGTARPLSWWRALLAADDAQARAYAKSHGRRAAEVMTRDVITVAEDTELPRITDRKS